MDLTLIVPHAAEAQNGEWKKSSLEAVKEYILYRPSDTSIK